MATIKADLDECMGYGNCVLGAEDYFDEVDGQVQLLKTEVEPGDEGRVEESIASCPVNVLSLQK